VGNRLVDGDFLREHKHEYRVLHYQNQNQAIATSASRMDSSENQSDASSLRSQMQPPTDKRQIVEINPIPSSRLQMQLTANERGQWIEYHDFKSEKYAIETGEQELKYLQLKLAQLTGQTGPIPPVNPSRQDSGQATTTTTAIPMQANSNDPMLALLGQTGISVLVIRALDLSKHTSRYACRATTRANTDEVTTVVRVQGKCPKVMPLFSLAKLGATR